MPTELIRIAATGAEPVTLADAKFWLRIEDDDDSEDALVSSLVTAARQWAERFCSRSFTPGELWQLTLDRFPLSGLGVETWWGSEFYDSQFESFDLWLRSRPAALALEIPMGPVTAITSITYLDATGTQQTLSGSAYRLLPSNVVDVARIIPAFGTTWPVAQPTAGAVTVNFTAGATPDEDVKIAIKMVVNYWYSRPEVLSGDSPPVPAVAKQLLFQQRVLNL